ncbi:probable G-protein coupled receptor 141 [Brienomyrus brachyistius]|uniref:probable G-protein coupled receptor 141 n=1 Tax=Brienomyrus brachyistius TaxID=42636 RepID=UPI0020B1AB86|nr:probable G-protein coupled receptor 141 [Brienomyrus brachyistius]
MPNLNNTSSVTFPLDGTSSVALVWIYSLTLIGGIVGIIFMSFILSRQKDKLSITNISIINLVVVHGTFLLTVPFRIHYFATQTWTSSFYFCKLISIVIHTHLYLSFFFYLAILVVRFLPVIGRKPMGFNRPLIAFLASATVWLCFFLSIFPLLWINYGKDKKNKNDGTCFGFQSDIKDYVITVNIILAVVIIATSCAALVILLLVLMKIARSNHGNLFSHQEFRAQINNIRFIAIMFICFLPYHTFRIYYVLHLHNDQTLANKNEVYLAITSLCCWDLLTFVIIKR